MSARDTLSMRDSDRHPQKRNDAVTHNLGFRLPDSDIGEAPITPTKKRGAGFRL